MLGKRKQSKEEAEATFSTRPPRLKNVHSPGVKLPKRLVLKPLALLLGVFLIAFGGGWLGARSYEQNSSKPLGTSASQKYISSESELISNIAEDVGESVVSIDVASNVNTRDIFGLPQSTQQQSAGTGFIVSSDGVIVTNRHVVPEGADNVSVTLSDGAKFDGVKVIGRTSQGNSLDIAFLKITDLKGKKLAAATLGDSSKVKVGDKVVAIGNALGEFQNTVTSGIISGYGRDVVAGDETGQNSASLTDLFQTDAAINAGNSGGPLVNINGEVIGVNTAVAGDAQNIGFAIPINDIKGLIGGVLETGELKQPYVGVRYVALNDDYAYQYNLDIKRGAYLAPNSGGEPSIIKDSPADKAGLQEKDVIIKVNDIEIDDKNSLASVLTKFQVGDTVTLTVVRDGKTITANATLEELPKD